ncbi:MarR family winged helix-turn-helix transcriptional regulator [Lysinibacillus xylanilyticus]|uniref:MarR family winged helix-turn-helix transcriptional regulator n=1 Tax=Lysinibacillus xylanilyticus TaxID=582475 RepID=UPI0036D9C5DB
MSSKRRSVGLELRTLSLLMRRQLDQTTWTTLTERDNLTTMHGWTISYLYKNQDKDVFQKDFEREFSIRKSTASRILKSMENNGLIARQTVPYDTRLKKIVLTEDALKIHDSIMIRRAKLEQKLLTGIPEEKLEVFFEVMDAMKENIES